MFKVGNYPKGYDLSLLNTMYHYPSKQSDGKYSNDSIDLIIKDNITGDKFLETIESPVYDYYMIKNEEYVSHNMFFIEEEKTDRITVPFRDLLKDIAEKTDNMNFFKENIYNMIKERKRTYSQEEVNELKKWFDSQELPPTMQIDKAAFTPNLKDTVDMLFEQAYVCYENPKMQGCLYLLEKIKSNLEKNGTGA